MSTTVNGRTLVDIGGGMRWMLFVDGDNFAIRGRIVMEKRGLTLADGDSHKRDVFLWLPNLPPRQRPLTVRNALALDDHAIRSHYYTSMVGDYENIRSFQTRLSKIGFHPEVFKRPKEGKAKGVDVTLTRDMLAHAFKNNYDAAVLLAGDADYIPVVDEVKRAGKIVYLLHLSGDGSGYSEDLGTACDDTFDFTDTLYAHWQAEITRK